ncbi:MAG: glycosyltransferase [Pseudomonadota bacterium]|jgi:glycosyltransferase involved in cell wall biosynthesis
MTILHLMGAPAEGGAETYFLELVRALGERGHKQAAVIRPHKEREAALAKLGVPVRLVDYAPLMRPLNRWRIERFARQVNAKTILGWMSRGAEHAPEGPWTRIGRLGGYYHMQYFKGQDFLIGNTQHIVDYIKGEGWPADRVDYIPNFATADDAPAISRATYATPEGAPLLLGMGRLHSDKAHDISLRALTRLPDAYLWIAGSGVEEAALKALATELGVADRVRFLGWVSDAAALYRTADVCVFPSRVEPFGNVVIQAWAHETPVVAGASTGPKALVRDEVDALLIPLESPEALADAARRLLDDETLRRRLMAEGAARVALEFSEDAIVARWERLFDDVARSKAAWV